jgi:hypothetical protein
MRAVLFAAFAAASVAAGCKIDLEKAPPDASSVIDAALPERFCRESTAAQVCLEAATHSDFSWLKQNMFATNCGTDDCHGATTNGADPGGRFLLTDTTAYMNLLGKTEMDPGPAPGVMSEFDSTKPLVVPGNPNASYLMFLVKGLTRTEAMAFIEPPADVGYMPSGNNTLCCQKLDALSRWIAAGATP